MNREPPVPFTYDIAAVDLRIPAGQMPVLAPIAGSCALRRVREEFGGLQNMSKHPIEIDGLCFRTSEAAFQALRFPAGHPVIEDIRSAKSPMQAKWIAKAEAEAMVVPQMSYADVANMARCLAAKFEAHDDIRKVLMGTERRYIVEDCTSRQRGSGLFWGAARVGQEWRGHNVLGRLWMALREARR